MPDHLAYFDNLARLRTICWNSQNSIIAGFNILRCLFVLQSKQQLAIFNKVAILLEPAYEIPLLHRPPKSRNNDFDGHDFGEVATRSRARESPSVSHRLR